MMIFIAASSTLLAQARKDTSLSLFYGTGKFELTIEQKQEVLKFLEAISVITEIHGYTDSTGTLLSNRKLGTLRAQFVSNFIAQSFRTNVSPMSSGEEFTQDAESSKNRKVVVSADLNLNLPLDTAKIETIVLDSFDVQNINFLPDQATLTPESLRAIPSLISKIRHYNNAIFEIIGHVNYQSKRDPQYLKDLYALSKERAKSICQILYENGIAKNRLRYVGIGNSQPLIQNPKNNDEKRKNMRVQIIVSSQYRNHPDIKLEDFK